MSEGVLVNCKLADCAYHHHVPGESLTRCMHQDKRFYSKPGICPLYKLDWQRADRAPAQAQAGASD